MMVSTKGRYALRVIIDLAQHKDEGYVSLKSISERQKISLKYLEMIAASLNRAGLVQSQRGKEGGYMLTKPAAEYTVGAVLRAAEGDLAPVSCLDCGENTCERADSCITLPMWQRLDGLINGYLDSVSIEDMLKGEL
ncbi:MAG: RrF2 family transcriptional regulator [Clostridiales bacterium]|jgi:Rrf2 family protein|nr:RrF2 family transcriptional regulator [Clostridiales bacterium]